MKRTILSIIILLILTPVFLFGENNLKSDKSRYSYTIAQQVGSYFIKQKITISTTSFMDGIKDALINKNRHSSAELSNVLIKMKQKKEKATELDIKLYSYALALQVGNKIRKLKFDLDIMTYNQGLNDALNNKSKLNDNELKDANNILMKIIDSKKREVKIQSIEFGNKYLEKNRKKDGVIVTESGLQYEVLKKGAGEHPKKTDRIKVHYRGTLIDGTEIDSSYKRKNPSEFLLNKVIQGWVEGIQLMRKGAKYRFIIPSGLAYGEMDRASIPGNSVLIFEVELIDIIK